MSVSVDALKDRGLNLNFGINVVINAVCKKCTCIYFSLNLQLCQVLFCWILLAIVLNRWCVPRSFYKMQLNGAVFRSVRKYRSSVSRQVCNGRDVFCKEAVVGEHRPSKMCNPSTAMETSPYRQNILQWDVKQQTNKENSLSYMLLMYHSFFSRLQ